MSTTTISGFKSKNDYCGLSVLNLELASTSENRSVEVAEAVGENGFCVANMVYGEKMAPVCDYVVKGNVTLGSKSLGGIKVINTKSYALEKISIKTAAGTAPTVNATCQQVEDNATSACTAVLDSVSINGLHHAQTFGAFTMSGSGAHLIDSSLDATCKINLVTKDGVVIAHDITDARVEVNGTIQVAASQYAVPTVTPSNGWEMTSPLTENNPNGDFPTYTFGMTKYLTGVEPSSN